MKSSGRGQNSVFGCHKEKQRTDSLTTEEALQGLFRLKTNMKEAQNLLRLPAKEVMVALITDLDRTKQADVPHAMPIAYGFGGYSIKMTAIRSLLYQLVDTCYTEGVQVSVIAFDGQFYKVAVREAENKPLTVHTL